MYHFNGRIPGNSIPRDEFYSSSRIRVENDARLYGLAQTSGKGSHGQQEATPKLSWARLRGHHYRWPVDAETWADAIVWFETVAWGGEEVRQKVDLYYEISASAPKTKSKDDKETVTMVREKVDYLDRNGMLTFRWDTSECKWISNTVSSSGYSYHFPSYGLQPNLHSGEGTAGVSGLIGEVSEVRANYRSP